MLTGPRSRSGSAVTKSRTSGSTEAACADGERVEKLTFPQLLSLCGGQLRLITDLVPLAADRLDVMLDDPRILPFHICEARRHGRRALGLDDAPERKRFRELHMRDGELEDASKRRWRAAEPNARHGRDPQFVRSLELPLGFHWDVRKFNGTCIGTPMSVWKVDRGGHINAYADGHIRPGTSCRPIWTEKQSKSADGADRRKSSA